MTQSNEGDRDAMRKLYVLRHGVAVPHGTPGIPDDDRPLTSDGEEKTRAIASALRKLDLDLEVILSSPLPRARRTAEIVADRLGMSERLVLDDHLRAGSSPRSIRDWLASRPEEVSMVVGHNPDLSELVALICGLSISPLPLELRKGGVAAIESRRGGFELAWLATPKLLRKLAD